MIAKIKNFNLIILISLFGGCSRYNFHSPTYYIIDKDTPSRHYGTQNSLWGKAQGQLIEKEDKYIIGKKHFSKNRFEIMEK